MRTEEAALAEDATQVTEIQARAGSGVRKVSPQGLLSGRKAVKGDGRVHVMGGVNQHVVENGERPGGQMDIDAQVGLVGVGTPGGLVIEPRDVRMGVMNQNNKRHQPIPDEERQEEGQKEVGRRMGQEGKDGRQEPDEETVREKEARLAARDTALVDDEAGVPDFEQVVEGKPERMVIKVGSPAEGGSLGGRNPDEIFGAEIREAVMDHVMSEFPAEKRGERRQEQDAAHDLVDAAGRGEGLMAGIVPQDEEACGE